MQLTDFHFELPAELIAQVPLPKRSDSRLLVQKGAAVQHCQFSELPDLLQPGDHLVFNNTRVIPARLFGHKDSGGKLELLVERIIGENELLTKIRASRSPKVGTTLYIGGASASGGVIGGGDSTDADDSAVARNRAGEDGELAQATVLGRVDDLFRLAVTAPRGNTLAQFVQHNGQLPLPPYIERQPDQQDTDRYQTVYAQQSGAVAAPTAGLHFDNELFAALAARDIGHSFVTLHVGAGTFMPVREDNISEHVMHPEWAVVPAETVEEINAAKRAGGRIIAVGTTSVRALEAASSSGALQPFADETRLFITPGSTFHTVDAMITNFHLPESTLLMLVSAFGGYENTRAAYRDAITQRYRFFSYGDAMLIWPSDVATAPAPDLIV